MVLDTSIILAIALNQPEAEALERQIVDDDVRLISAATVLEAAIALESMFGEAAGRELDLWLYRVNAEIVPVDGAQIDIARRAFRQFGKGRHAAGLDYGDCFSYALAATSGEPLFFAGDGFALIDVPRAGDHG